MVNCKRINCKFYLSLNPMESTALIIQNVSVHINLDEKEKEFFISLLEPLTLKRKQILLAQGQVCRHSIFVNSGCLRGYMYDRNAMEHVVSFAPQGWWIGDMYSLISQKPGIQYIEAIEETTVLRLSKDSQELLFREVPKFERFFRILIENSLVAYQQRLIDNLSLTAEERYLKLSKQLPSLINRLPLNQIASYIGVTPQYFSKMRKRMLLQ